MATRVTHKLNTQALHELLYSRQGAVAKEMLRRGLKVESAAKKNLANTPQRIDTGRLRASIGTRLITYNGKPAVRVGTNVEYARYVHDGTGIYGPYSQRIYPKTKRALRWASGGGYVYARYTLGMQPNPFLRDALKAARG